MISEKEKLYNFVYITINLINWKMYVGDHSTNDLNLYKTKIYLGSGKHILSAIKKYNKQNFIRIDLEFFNTKQEAFEAQEKYIKLFNTLQPNGYNISPKGGHLAKNGVSDSTKQKISKSKKGRTMSEESKQKMRKPKTQEHIKHLIESHLGIKNSEESKIKNGNAHRGMKRSKETRLKMRIAALKRYNHYKE